MEDGTLVLRVVVTDISNVIPIDTSLGYAPVANAELSLKSRKYYTDTNTPAVYMAYTDSNGIAEFRGLEVCGYTLFAQAKKTVIDSITGEPKEITLSGGNLPDIFEPLTIADTIKTIASVSSGLVINEIYYTGPPNRAFYFYDQFVELYNGGTKTLYLDGLIICRARGTVPSNIEEVDYMQALYVYQFPGVPVEGEEYPIEPGEFCVIAQDAINHSLYIEGAADLSGAGWEFYNPYKGDWDSPAQDVVNALPERPGTDFMISLTHDAVILAEGKDFYPGDWNSSQTSQYTHIPLNRVLDVVEYSTNPEKKKEVTIRVDAGFAGIGIAKYDGQSTERRIPGSDTNNSTLDYVTIKTPTPGYHHE